jgi:hypothetical protein
MTFRITGDRTESGKILDNVVIGPGGRLVLDGLIGGTLQVESGGYAHVRGLVNGLVVEDGGAARLDGMCTGDVHNFGGELVVAGMVAGRLHGRMYTQIVPGSRIIGVAS